MLSFPNLNEYYSKGAALWWIELRCQNHYVYVVIYSAKRQPFPIFTTYMNNASSFTILLLQKALRLLRVSKTKSGYIWVC